MISNHTLLRDLNAIYKKEEEYFKDFNLRSRQTKTKIPTTLRLMDEILFYFYMQALDPEMRYILIDKGINNLADAMTTIRTIENNLVELGKKVSITLASIKL